MKKVLIINSNTEITPYPVAPLGVALVASSLKNRYNVKVFDAAFNTKDELIKLLNEFNPDFVGVGIRNIDNVTMRRCKWYLSDIKSSIIKPLKENYCGPIIIGGSAFSIAPQQMLDFFNVDYGIIGEGEHRLPELLAFLEDRKDVFPANVISKKQNESILSGHKNKKLKLPQADIDSFIDYNPYNTRGSYPIQTKRGCAYRCIYCSYPNIEGNRFRLRDVNEIVDEIEVVSQRIPKVTFEFVDSVFNAPYQHAVNICKEIIKRNVKVPLRTMGVNPGTVTDELIYLMKKAGFTQIDCTPDSASETMIKSYRKNFSKDKLIHCANIIRKHDIPTMWFFLFGGPGETQNTILETFDFMDKYISTKDMVHVTEGIRILPDTDLYRIAVKEDIISENESIIHPMFYVNPSMGKEKLTQILEMEIYKRANVLNSMNTTPSPELIAQAMDYRKIYQINEPMFRTLLRLKKEYKKTE